MLHLPDLRLLIAAALTLALPATAQTLLPGQWELSQTRSGGPLSDETVTRRVCFSADTLAADPAAPLKLQTASAQGSAPRAPRCQAGPVSMVDGQAHYSARCEGPMGTLPAEWSGQYRPADFEMQGTMQASFFTLRLLLRGRHLGDCPAS